MAMKSLSVGEMVAISSPWTNPVDPARKLLLESSRLNGLVADIDAAHKAIYAVQPDANTREAEIVQEAAEADAEHDRFARGIYGVLTESALLDTSGDAAVQLRDLMFPEGLPAVINTTYRGQAGHGALVRDRLTPERRDQLQTFHLFDAPLLGKVDAWLDSADKLGLLESERARRESPESPSRKRQVLDARHGWIRVVNALQSIADLAELDEDADRLLFGALRAAEITADRRAARRRAQGEEADEGEEEIGSLATASAE